MSKIIIQIKHLKLLVPTFKVEWLVIFLFASGQIPLSPETGEIVGSTIEEQTEQSSFKYQGYSNRS